ncbi:MAG: J domain-containing protein, partial [Nostoc sp.]
MRDVFDINDAYEILGLKPGASQAQVKRTYRKLVKIWHPDRFVDQKQKQEAE